MAAGRVDKKQRQRKVVVRAAGGGIAKQRLPCLFNIVLEGMTQNFVVAKHHPIVERVDAEHAIGCREDRIAFTESDTGLTNAKGTARGDEGFAALGIDANVDMDFVADTDRTRYEVRVLQHARLFGAHLPGVNIFVGECMIDVETGDFVIAYEIQAGVADAGAVQATIRRVVVHIDDQHANG
jgi:hypothetical protein